MIIVVEDNPEFRLALCEYIALLGYKAKGFGVAEKALSFLHNAKQAPDLIIADVQLPEMDGLQMIGQARIDYPSVPVIVISSCDVEQDCSRLQPEIIYLNKTVPLRTIGKNINHALSENVN